MSDTDPTIAYLSRGRLLYKLPGRPPQEVESHFARQTLERRERQRQQHGWKGESGLWGNLGMEDMSAVMLAPMQAGEPRRPIQFSSVARGDGAAELFYLLDLHGVNGLFRYDVQRDEELRLMHRNDFPARDLARHPGSGSVAVCMPREDGTVGIVVGENDGRFLRDVTFGDSHDEAPSWVSGDGRRIVFQSAGIGRDHLGHFRGLSPYRIEIADLDAQQITVVLEDDGHDLLQPRQLADGTLHFVRRPYRHGPPPPSLWAVAKNVLLYPVRFLVGVHHFFNFFSMIFTGKPLITAGGPRREQSPEQRFLMHYGHAIDLQKARERGTKDEPAGIAPKDWLLVRRAPDGTETTLAEGVLSYDVLPGGDVLYTDGTRITLLAPDGRSERLCTDELIERVVLLPRGI